MNATDLFDVSLAGATWRKSTYTANNDQCVEVAKVPTSPVVAVRDSKNIHLAESRVSRAAWARFIIATKTDDCRHA